MTSKIRKTLALGISAVLAFGAAIAVGPGAALAAEPEHWSYQAPWAAVNSGDAIVPPGFRIGTGDTVAIQPDGALAPVYSTEPTYAGLGAVERSDGNIGYSQVPVSSTHRFATARDGLVKAEILGETEVLLFEPQPSVTLDLVDRFEGTLPLTGRAYLTDAGDSGAGRWMMDDFINQSESYGQRGYTVTPVMDGVRFDFDTSNGWEDVFHGGSIRVAVELADGSQAYIMVHITMLNYGGQPTVGNLGYSTKVGETLEIPRTALTNAVSWSSGVDTAVTVADLPSTVTETPTGFSWTPTVVGEEGFFFAGTERQAPANTVATSGSGRVGLTALAADVGPEPEPEPEPEPLVIPTVRDYTLPGPVEVGDYAAGIGTVIPVLDLTDGGFDRSLWMVQPSFVDALPSIERDGELVVFPETAGAYEMQWRWVLRLDTTIWSNWSTVTAPAAPVDPTDPVEPTEPVTPTEPTDPVTPTEPTPTPEVAPSPEATLAPADPAKPTPPSIVKTGVEVGPLGFLMGLLAVIVAAGALPFSRRFAQR